MMERAGGRRETVRVCDLVTGYRSRSEVKEVSKRFDATLLSGELTCLLGPNGAGKSTLLRTLSAFQPAIGGSIEIEGRPLADYSSRELSRLIGVVLTERVSLSNMTVSELVGLGRSPYTDFWGRLLAHDLEVTDRAIRLVGIDDLRERPVGTLSDGERQKTMIAKTLAQETPIIFLDEPTAFLDYPSKVEIMQLLQRLAREEGKTVFLSTHDLELALQIADRVWLIDKTRGVEIGVPEDLALNGALVRYFEREGVVFDMSTGLFRINAGLSRSVIVTGDRHSGRMSMVVKALARVGVLAVYAASEELPRDVKRPDMTVEVTADAFIVDGSRRCVTIAGMLETVLHKG